MDKIEKKSEEEEVWQNPIKTANKQVLTARPTESLSEEKKIVEELKKLKTTATPRTTATEEPLDKEVKEGDKKDDLLTQNQISPKNFSNSGKFIRWTGNFLIIISIVGLFFTFWPIFTAEIAYRVERFKGIKFTIGKTQINQTAGEKVTFGDLLGKSSPKILIPKSTDFGVIVEKIGANSPVIANVDAADPKEYNQKLQKGVAHAKGTVFPGQKGLSYLFAHSTLNPWDVPRYNAVFYLLRELETGDRIVVFYKDVRYDYFVTEKRIVAPNNVSIFSENFQEPVLVLQTCDPPGTTWRRLLVIAKMRTS